MKLKITVHGVAYEVDVEVLDAGDDVMQKTSGPLPSVASAAAPVVAPAPVANPGSPAPVPSLGPSGAPGSVASPIAGTVLELKVKAGDSVTQGQALLVIEAMKMETAISAPAAGTVKAVLVAAGDSVRENQTLVELN